MSHLPLSYPFPRPFSIYKIGGMNGGTVRENGRGVITCVRFSDMTLSSALVIQRFVHLSYPSETRLRAMPHARLFISDTALDIFANLIIRSLGEFVKLDGNRLISAVLRRRFKSSIKVFSGLH